MTTAAIIQLPKPHENQKIFFDWQDLYPKAQCLVAPAGTKVGKTWGSSTWILKEALLYEGIFCVWIAPTYLKARIGYRYIKAMLPDEKNLFDCVDGRLEIRFANGSFIKFLHGRDAEITVEGEAVDRFVIDEAGKIDKQVWYSLFTTISQTQGYGIVTGTPRGFGWFHEIWKKGKSGDEFFHSIRLRTEDSPYVKKESIENARRLLPKHLFDQYYEAKFVTGGTVFGDLAIMFDPTFKVGDGITKFWIHPDDKARNGYIVHGMDIAKKRDYTVIYSVNSKGQLVGYCRFRHVAYPRQAQRLESYINRYFNFPESDNSLFYDATGVGEAFGDILNDLDLDMSVNPVEFTNKRKNEMVTRLTLAIEQGWHKAPRIEELEHELSVYEVSITKLGSHTYSAPQGEHDDIVSACMLAVSNAYQSALAEETEKLLDNLDNTDDSSDWASINDEDDFFDDDSEGDEDLDEYLLEG